MEETQRGKGCKRKAKRMQRETKGRHKGRHKGLRGGWQGGWEEAAGGWWRLLERSILEPKSADFVWGDCNIGRRLAGRLGGGCRSILEPKSADFAWGDCNWEEAGREAGGGLQEAAGEVDFGA